MNLLRILPLTSCCLLLVLTSPCWSQMIVAHRGASYDAPENTLAAFRLAWQQGSDGIEGDFYLTADREIVCIHDRDTKRTAGVNLVVEDSTLASLRELEYGSWKGPKWDGEPIATFEEVWNTVPDGKWFVIELKSKRKIVPVLAEQMKRLDIDRIRTLIITFDQDTATACKELLPDQRIHWLTSFDRDKVSGLYQPTASTVAATVNRLGVQGVGFNGNREVIDAAFIKTLTDAGCDEYHVWTVDSIDDARFFQSLGVVGVTTNRPDEIGRALRNSR